MTTLSDNQTCQEQESCRNCGKEITRTGPGDKYPWFHCTTGSENCHPITKAAPERRKA